MKYTIAKNIKLFKDLPELFCDISAEDKYILYEYGRVFKGKKDVLGYIMQSWGGWCFRFKVTDPFETQAYELAIVLEFGRTERDNS